MAEPAIAGFWQAQGVWPRALATYIPDQPVKTGGGSRLALFQTLRNVSQMKDADAILRELGRNDPSGYWTTIVLGTVAYYESTRRDAALTNDLADALPGIASGARPNALSSAARRHLQARELRTVQAK